MREIRVNRGVQRKFKGELYRKFNTAQHVFILKRKKVSQVLKRLSPRSA